MEKKLMLTDANVLMRENIRKMKKYSSARSEYSGKAAVFLDANENSLGSPAGLDLNRYPDPMQIILKERISILKSVPAKNIFLGNGSDEAIDNLIRVFCEPGKDRVMISSPTYGMYKVAADTNNVEVLDVPLKNNFQLDVDAMISVADKVKMIFICSPNNPSGNRFRREDIVKILKNVSCMTVIDEAYIDFAAAESFTCDIEKYPGLAVMQTFSKAWGLAGARLGLTFAQEPLIDVMNKIKYPYNVNDLTARAALTALDNVEERDRMLSQILSERDRLVVFFEKCDLVHNIYPSDANFLLIRVENASVMYNELLRRGIVVRNRSNLTHCTNCLRVTVGTSEENRRLMSALNSMSREMTK